ncbi:2-deoxy-glucose resistant protein 2 [Cinnamomum micranthum f. kanehirae]|uniref:2-deoxy-glucose resistant protein 2 n=1 Tax=Cinnamomum micranthum f. kanehirae TaxID=337451 RepID=A0A443N3G1_9MAGN|nr:2-deoxy-glucose resistant protein 2 [Cinnamomum micranthum f. kanehirae]
MAFVMRSSTVANLSTDGFAEEILICRNRNLDDGTEFIVDEMGQDGTVISLREVGLDRLFTIDEFHRTFRISEKPIHEFHGHCGNVLDLSWSSKKHLLSSSEDKTVRLWQVGCSRCLRVVTWPLQFATALMDRCGTTSQAWMLWFMQKRKAFDQRGDVAMHSRLGRVAAT